MISRRGFLGGILAAPAIVSAAGIMRINPRLVPPSGFVLGVDMARFGDEATILVGVDLETGRMAEATAWCVDINGAVQHVMGEIIAARGELVEIRVEGSGVNCALIDSLRARGVSVTEIPLNLTLQRGLGFPGSRDRRERLNALVAPGISRRR